MSPLIGTDLGLGQFDLHYIRDTAQREVDFLISRDAKPWIMIEVKKVPERAPESASEALCACPEGAACLPGGDGHEAGGGRLFRRQPGGKAFSRALENAPLPTGLSARPPIHRDHSTGSSSTR